MRWRISYRSASTAPTRASVRSSGAGAGAVAGGAAAGSGTGSRPSGGDIGPDSTAASVPARPGTAFSASPAVTPGDHRLTADAQPIAGRGGALDVQGFPPLGPVEGAIGLAALPVEADQGMPPRGATPEETLAP